MSKRFAICDDVGKALNVILMDDTSYPTNWYPGYGRYLVALEAVTPPSAPIHPTKLTFNAVQVQGRCGPGDTINLSTGVVTPLTPPTPPPPTKDELRAYVSNKRWEVETGGCPWGGHVVATDRDSQSKLIASVVAMQMGMRPDPSGWKMASGAFVTLTNEQMMGVIVATHAHIAAAFDVEEEVLSSITNNGITTYAQIDAASWPANG